MPNTTQSLSNHHQQRQLILCFFPRPQFLQSSFIRMPVVGTIRRDIAVHEQGNRNNEEESPEKVSPPSFSHKARSVNHFASLQELQQALASKLGPIQGSYAHVENPAWLFSQPKYCKQFDSPLGANSKKDNTNKTDMATSPLALSLPFTSSDHRSPEQIMDPRMDWVLENYDEASTEKQSM